jgi:heme exporter protein CcmD
MSGSGLPSMGGYALYVWGSYALTLMALGGEVFLLLRRWRARRGETSATDAHGTAQVQV